MSKQQQRKSVGQSATLTILEFEQSKAVVLSTLASVHSRRAMSTLSSVSSPGIATNPDSRLTGPFVVTYRSALESLCMFGATINLHLSAIRRLAGSATLATASFVVENCEP